MHKRQFLNIRYIFLFIFHLLKTPGRNYLHFISCSLLRRIREEFNYFSCFNSFQIQSHKKIINFPFVLFCFLFLFVFFCFFCFFIYLFIFFFLFFFFLVFFFFFFLNV